ncbi:DUF4097 domain-containing protein [Streptomyces sp. ASQP_92]|uniref:DUF4097 domain-containing protein n=1 Tax=Streptomyces sp. ASQP_92 TaxID=2979116 RepID=UPI0021C0B180|nr:DUF4097 domain-containing protein [Streptomyces sp. ASQP_92]MCT9087784.1 DUF4097 domain-containing protein [Streptomyces sp. ASQP_92]
MSTTEQHQTPTRGAGAPPAGASATGDTATGGRPRHRTAWIVVAFLGALLVVAPSLYWTLADSVSQTARYESPDNGHAHPVSAVEVDAGSARITVKASAADHVTLNGRLTWAVKRPSVERTWDGDTLKLRTRCVGFVDQVFGNCQVDLDLAIPATTRLTVRSGSGETVIRDLSAPVDIRSGSGSIKLTGLAGTVSAKTGSGELRTSQLTSPYVTLNTGSGSLDATFSAAPRQVTARTGSGSVTVTVPEGTRYRVSGSSGSGSRDIQDELLDNNSDRLLKLSTGSGSVNVGYPGF